MPFLHYESAGRHLFFFFFPSETLYSAFDEIVQRLYNYAKNDSFLKLTGTDVTQ